MLRLAQDLWRGPQGVDGIGIKNQWPICLAHERLDELARHLRAAESRANEDGIVPLNERHERLERLAAAEDARLLLGHRYRHRLRKFDGQDGLLALGHGERRDAAARAQAGLRAKCRRPRHTARARDDEDAATGPLVSRPRTGRQQRSRESIVDARLQDGLIF